LNIEDGVAGLSLTAPPRHLAPPDPNPAGAGDEQLDSDDVAI